MRKGKTRLQNTWEALSVGFSFESQSRLYMNTFPLCSVSDLPHHIDKSVRLRGWMQAMRSSGKIRFVEFRDGTGTCQCTVEASQPGAFAAMESCGQESSMTLTGSVREEPRSPGGVEVSVEAVEVHQKSQDYPISRKEHGVDFLMQHRHLWLRSPRQCAIMRIRHRLITAARAFFDQRGFTLIDTPIFQPGAAEGAGTLFDVDYFGSPAYLAQTGQLYLETAAMALGKVYCFGPTFRAEKSKTRRHLTEFWMIEPEVAFYELEDLQRLAEEFLCGLVEAVLTHQRADLEELGRDVAALERIQAPFPRLTYSEAVELLHSPDLQMKLEAELEGKRGDLQALKAELANKEGQLAQVTKAWKVEKLKQEIQEAQDRIRELERWIANQPAHIEDARQFEWGRDFGGDEETILSKQFDCPLIVSEYPREVKAFYMKQNAQDPRTVRNLDVLAPEGYGEIIGGSQREDDLDLLLARMQAEGMDPEPYQWYLDLRRYGSVPHGGFGLGLERTVSWICGLKHIRETIPFPRLMGKMIP
jgi:asparaginyl-tRNA synthetase